jgi:hypothetical protein
MKTLHTLALNRTDLKDMFKNTPIEDIRKQMFPFFNTGVQLHEDIIVFIDDDRRMVVLENKCGEIW